MKGRWFQFRLRALFVLVTLAALVTGVVQHLWFVRARIAFHQGKLAACEERLAMKVNINALAMRRTSLSRIHPAQADQSLPSGHLLYFPPGVSSRSQSPDATELIDELGQETNRVQKAQRHHLRQIDLYRQATWRPWMRVVEDRSQELPGEVEENVPVPPSNIPLIISPYDDEIPTSIAEETSDPIEPVMRFKVKQPWQPIERPLPRDFENRDVQSEKSAAA